MAGIGRGLKTRPVEPYTRTQTAVGKNGYLSGWAWNKCIHVRKWRGNNTEQHEDPGASVQAHKTCEHSHSWRGSVWAPRQYVSRAPDSVPHSYKVPVLFHLRLFKSTHPPAQLCLSQGYEALLRTPSSLTSLLWAPATLEPPTHKPPSGCAFRSHSEGSFISPWRSESTILLLICPNSVLPLDGKCWREEHSVLSSTPLEVAFVDPRRGGDLIFFN